MGSAFIAAGHYVQLHPENLFRRAQPGIVCGGTTTPMVVELHYIPLDETPSILNPDYFISGDECLGPFDGTWVMYQALPNDSAVTGFENTSAGPFYPVVMLPTSP